MILCSWLYGVWVCSIFVFPELYLCVALIYDGRENMSSLVWVAMINQGVKFILFDIIALWLVSWWSTKGKDDKMELYVVCSLICIMMIRQGVFSFLLLNIFALWLVSWWSAKAKCQDGARWRLLLGLYHNDQPRTNFLLLNISALWLVSRWSAKAKCQDEDTWGILLGLYHNDQPRRKMNMMRDIGRSKKIRGGSWFPPGLPSSRSSPDDGPAVATYMSLFSTAAVYVCGWEKQWQHNSSKQQHNGAIRKREPGEQPLWCYL